MLLRKMNTFSLLREGESEGGAGGDSMSALEKRNQALEARLERTEGALQQLGNQSKQTQAQQQVEQAKARVDQAVNEAAAAVDSAERELAEAIDDGEGHQVAAAQRKMSEAAAKRERVNAEADNFNRQIAESEKRKGGSASPELDTTNLNNWKDRNNEWYGIDQEMTRASHEIDSSVRQAGTFKVGSDDYFKAIDRAMKQRFPDRFAGAPASAGARAESSGGGRPAPRRYNESIQRGMDAFGMSAESWDKARSKAVAKGLLSAEPARGRIMG